MANNPMAMSVPGASDTSLADQVAGESELQRRKRLQQQQLQSKLPIGQSSLAAGYSAAFGQLV